MKFGDFELFVVSDGFFRLDGGAMFGIVPRPLWEKKIAPDERNRIKLGMNCLLVRAHGKNILVDTGIGNKFSAKFQEIYAVERATTVVGSLAARGLRPEDVDIVFNTHLHFDHAGGNLSRLPDGTVRPTFPRATCWIPRGDWEHGLHATERDRASYVTDDFLPLESRVEIRWVMKESEEIVPGVEAIHLRGHTFHMRAVRVSSGGQTAFFFCDIVPTIWHLPFPWIMGFDIEPLETLKQKKHWIPLAAREHWLCFFCHDPAVPAAYIEERDGRFEAAPCKDPALVSVSD